MDMVMMIANGVLRSNQNRDTGRKTKNPDVEQAALVGLMRNGRGAQCGTKSQRSVVCWMAQSSAPIRCVATDGA